MDSLRLEVVEGGVVKDFPPGVRGRCRASDGFELGFELEWGLGLGEAGDGLMPGTGQGQGRCEENEEAQEGGLARRIHEISFR